ncbi:hypothetical protein RND81_01G108200 [Saponaria officinalis]|uniref:Retrovirus-related Pol polyprotein from transposon TNT 1-94 n=1 Tax=Saponaria officinalis TaxID=3572 RepID=A0AAW1NDG2_SAPOF
MEKAKGISTPMATSTKLDKDEDGKPVDEAVYRGMVGSLLYLTNSRSDIMQSVCLCARFQANPKESHFIAVKRILRYLIDTEKLYLFYLMFDNFDLKGYSDADYGGCSEKDYGVDFACVPIYCDNSSTIAISKNFAPHSRTKHIDIRHHFLRDHVEKVNIKLVFCPTEDQKADIFTKPLARERFEKLRLEIGLINGD